MKIIALYSDSPYSGKTTVAKYIEEKYGYIRYSFAHTLKDMIYTLLKNFNISDKDIEEYSTNKKEQIIPVINKSYRHLCQTLGTEWRDIVDRNLWLNHFNIFRANNKDKNIIIDDLRFPFEYEYLKKFNTTFIKVNSLYSPQVQKYINTHSNKNKLSKYKHSSDNKLDIPKSIKLLNIYNQWENTVSGIDELFYNYLLKWRDTSIGIEAKKYNIKISIDNTSGFNTLSIFIDNLIHYRHQKVFTYLDYAKKFAIEWLEEFIKGIENNSLIIVTKIYSLDNKKDNKYNLSIRILDKDIILSSWTISSLESKVIPDLIEDKKIKDELDKAKKIILG